MTTRLQRELARRRELTKLQGPPTFGDWRDQLRGLPGARGTPGARGHNGSPGQAGVDGAAGATGATGANGVDVPPQLMVGTGSLQVLGVPLAAIVAGALTTTTWPTANRAIFIPFSIPEKISITSFWWMNGATLTGLADIGIYDTSYTLIGSAGLTALAGASTVQTVATAVTPFGPGRFWLAFVMTVATDTITSWILGTNELGRALGIRRQSTAAPLPNPAAPTDAGQTVVPLCGWRLSA